MGTYIVNTSSLHLEEVLFKMRVMNPAIGYYPDINLSLGPQTADEIVFVGNLTDLVQQHIRNLPHDKRFHIMNPSTGKVHTYESTSLVMKVFNETLVRCMPDSAYFLPNIS